MSVVSIVIPAFNAGSYISQALEAIREQTFTDWEIRVVEDGSRDETQSIVEAFGRSVSQPVHYANNGTNEGVSITRNRAMAAARGDCIAFLDADDWWAPEHLARGRTALVGGADLSYSHLHLYDDSRAVSSAVESTAAPAEQPLVALFRSNFIQSSSAVMMRRDVVRKLDGFDPSLRVGEDWDYWLRALAAGARPRCTRAATCFYRKHAGSAMAGTLAVAKGINAFYRKHLPSDFLPRNLREQCYADSLFQYARLLRREQPQLAAELFAKVVNSRPRNVRYRAYQVAATMLARRRRPSVTAAQLAETTCR